MMLNESKKALTDEQLDQVSGGAGDLPERETITWKPGVKPVNTGDDKILTKTNATVRE